MTEIDFIWFSTFSTKVAKNTRVRQKLHCGIADIYQIDQHFDSFAAAHHVTA